MSRTRSPAQMMLEAEEAMRLHRLGYSMRDIATTMTAAGIKITKSTVERRLALGISATVLPDLEDARRGLIEEHRATISVFGPVAAGGDTKAADVVLKARQEIAKLVGAYATKTVDKPTPPAPAPAVTGYIQRAVAAKPTVYSITNTAVQPNSDKETADA